MSHRARAHVSFSYFTAFYIILLPKKELYNTSGVGKINNYCEDIYILPYNNTH